MTLSMALALFAAVSGCAAALVLVARSFGASDRLTALAQSGSARLREIERTRHGAGSDAAHVDLLRKLLEEARAGRFRRWPVRDERGALAAIGLAVLAMGGSSLLMATDAAAPTPPSVFAASATVRDPDLARLELYANARAPRPRAAAPMSTAQELPDVETMIERLAARLLTTPEDAEGWRMLGWSYSHVRQASRAADAYSRAAALRPQSPELKSAYGEALVAAEAGNVTPKAIEMFNAALALDARDAKARFFVALAMEQAGKKKEALDAWLVLQAEPLGDEPWVAELRERTQVLARELGVAVPAHSQLGVGN